MTVVALDLVDEAEPLAFDVPPGWEQERAQSPGHAEASELVRFDIQDANFILDHGQIGQLLRSRLGRPFLMLSQKGVIGGVRACFDAYDVDAAC